MGINGLLPLLKSIHKPCNLKKFEGKTLAVDAYGWLHRGTVACAMELAMGKPTRKFVDFAMHRVRMLQHFGVTPFLIFDGDYLPSKSATETDRSKRRENSRQAGLELLNAGKTSQAYLEFQKAVDVTPEMARQLIDDLKKAKVQYIVAPYEADAQMVYLERKGIVDGILSEDSDLLVFGAKCLLTKLDQYGNCIEINKADFCACREISLTGWSDTEFRHMAILSGCDYLSSINNMGLKTAYRMVRKHKNIEKVVRMLQFDGKFHVPAGYLEAFRQAELTFLHQWVYCPQALTLVLHTEPSHPIDVNSMHFIGAYVEPKIAQGVARGDLNPMSKKPIFIEKRSTTNPTTKAWMTSSRQVQSMASSNENFKSKPIDMFNARRVPLAELDVNCFTPSPSQQDALRRNSGPWLAGPSPRPYLNRSLTEAEQHPQSAPPLQARLSLTHVRASTVSEPRPPKRARLCADLDSVELPSHTVELARSRFFASVAPEPSPTVARNARSKRLKKKDISIFSDESLEEAMLNLPDVDQTGTALQPISKKLGIVKENDRTKHSLDEDDINTSQNTSPSIAASYPSNGAIDQSSTPTNLDSLPRPAQKLREKFAFAAKGVSILVANLELKDLSSPASTRPSRIPLAIKHNTYAGNVSSGPSRASLTPLQRLGATAAKQSGVSHNLPKTSSWPQKNKPSHRSLFDKTSLPFPEVARPSRKTFEAAMLPISIADKIAKTDLGGQLGSEDLIIHDSEGEECLEPGSDEVNIPAPRINIKKFAFAG